VTRLVTGTLPNLVNGVSQQAPALRLATQGEKQENFYSTIVEGLKDRPPSEFVAKLLDTLPDGTFTHVINRDKTERYIVIFDSVSGTLKVYDFQGVQKTVTAPSGWGYLSGLTAPQTQLAALTVADYTFFVNKTRTVSMWPTVEPARPYECLITVMAGNYGKNYQIIFNGGLVASFTTPNGSGGASDANLIDTGYIATQLYGQLAAAGFAMGGLFSNTIYFTTTSDFSIAVADGFNGNAMKAVKFETQRFSDLPAFGPSGFVCGIVGSSGVKNDKYWVKSESALNGSVLWKECAKPGTVKSFDPSTMPNALIRQADGTFTFGPMTWDTRDCGDGVDINPDPSFVGHTIADIFFHRNRLGFLSEENAIMSRNGSFFDFFRTTATAILDDDPIDVGASHVKVSLLKQAVPFQDDLLMFSDQTQFRLAGNELLTPKTVSMKPLTEFVSDVDVKPLALGTSVFFSAMRGGWEAMWEYAIDKATGTPDVSEITSHVPAFIPSGVYKIVGSSNESVVGVLTSGDPSALFFYRYYWSGQDKLQSAWQRWTLAGNPTILNAEFVDNDLYLVVKRSDGVFLEKLRVQPNAFDIGLGFLVHLDQRIHTDQLAAPTYDSPTRTTTYTLPYAPSTDIVAVTSPGSSSIAAMQVEVVSVNSGPAQTVTLKGDTRTYKMWFGQNYERRYRFSRFFLRQPAPNGGTMTVQTGRLQIGHLTLSYNNSSYFRIEVTPQGRQTYRYEVTGRVLGDGSNVLGSVPLRSGKKSVPILSRNDRVTIELVNESWMPSAFISAEWTGKHSEKVKEN
jgi:hypothetical protein